MEQEDIRKALRLEGVPPIYRRYRMRKKGGGFRNIYMTDDPVEKAAQRQASSMLDRNFEARFNDASFGYRRGKSARQAIDTIAGYIKEGYGVAAKLDVNRCFDNIPHRSLLKTIKFVPAIDSYYPFIERTLYTQYQTEDGSLCMFEGRGFMQGMVLAPMYCNIYLNKIDWWMQRNWQEVKFVRYADDMLIMSKSLRQARRVTKALLDFLDQSLGLTVSCTEPIVLESDSVCFLSIEISQDALGKAILRPTQDAYESLVSKVNFALEKGGDIVSVIRGWDNYFHVL
jgi:RNA-directed DNA polymerase